MLLGPVVVRSECLLLLDDFCYYYFENQIINGTHDMTCLKYPLGNATVTHMLDCINIEYLSKSYDREIGGF